MLCMKSHQAVPRKRVRFAVCGFYVHENPFEIIKWLEFGTNKN